MKRTLVDAGTLTKEQLKRKKVVVAPVDNAGYVTKGKKYKIIKNSEISFYTSFNTSFFQETKITTLCLFKGCAHLNGKNWLVYKYEN